MYVFSFSSLSAEKCLFDCEIVLQKILISYSIILFCSMAVPSFVSTTETMRSVSMTALFLFRPISSRNPDNWHIL